MSWPATNVAADPLRIAIVGCGPKGMYALDSVCTLASEARSRALLDVTLYEPAKHAGAGAIYDPAQPDYLIMNFASRFIDAGDRQRSCRSTRHPSLVEWLEADHPDHADPGGFVPRSIVGCYLNDCFRRILVSRPHEVSIACRRERVEAVRRNGEGWQVHSRSGASDFDEVLIATGHQDWQRKNAEHDQAFGVTSIRSIFPVETKLNAPHVPSGSVVGLQGFALTWIDASLALTVGRGGRFLERDGAFTYRPSGQEPARLVPLSRTGRPVLCKPDYRQFTSPASDDLWQATSDDILQLAGQAGSICFATQLWPYILNAADRALGIADGAARAWFEQWRAQPFHGAKALLVMRSSYQVATGQARPDVAWALGEAWRRTYPALVTCVSHGGLGAASWSAFAAIAREMERIASGPPAVNMGHMLALIDGGLMDLSHVSHFADASPAEWPADIDITIDATIPPPSQVDPAGPIDELLSAGHVTRGPGGGLVVDQSGQALSDGCLVPGLSVLGRPTEGCVLGNDTLNRALHRHPLNWARRMVERATAETVAHDNLLLERT